MKYRSDNLHDFEFHDAELSLIRFSDDELTVSAKMLNIHKGTEQNIYSTDMEIEYALITFHDFSLQILDLGEVWQHGADGQWFMSEKRGILTGAQGLEKFLCELQKWINVFRFGKSGDDAYLLEAGGVEEPWFEVEFTCDLITIEWDEYRKIAWYEERNVSTGGECGITK